MINNREIVLKLVRFATGWESDFTLPDDINWKQVLQIATEQGVSAIILDGYESYLLHNPGFSTSFSPSLKLKAIGQLQQIEVNYKKHLAALAELNNVLSKENVPFMLMKGFACGRYYPNPNHRPCGDIDIYPGEKYSESNIALEAAGIAVDPHYYRHSVSSVNGVMLENHRVLVDLRGPRRQTRALEAQLEKEAMSCIVHGKDVIIDGKLFKGVKYPSANFNALFLPWHVSAHFSLERVTLRHLLDWSLFMFHEGKNIDLQLFADAKRDYTYGYSKFADILTALSVDYLKMPTTNIPPEIVLEAQKTDKSLNERIFNYMFVGQPRERSNNIWKFRWNNLKRIWSERWKYKELYDMNTAHFILHKIRGVIFKVGDK